MSSTGLFSSLRRLARALQHAIVEKKVVSLHTPSPWTYAPPAVCTDSNGAYHSYECYFEPLGNCSYQGSEIPAHNAINAFEFFRDSRSACKAEWKDSPWVLSPGLVYDGCGVNAYRGSPFKTMTAFQWRSTVMGFLFRPKAEVKQFILQVMQAFAEASGSGTYLAMHVRRGDKVGKEMKEIDLADYATIVKTKAKERGIEPIVYVATDSPEKVIKPLEAHGLQVFINPLKECLDVMVSYEKVGKLKPEQVRLHVHCLLADLAIMAHAEHFIGTYSSNVGRTVVELMAAKRNITDEKEVHSFATSLDWQRRLFTIDA